MRVIWSLILSLVIAAPAMAQIGVRTATQTSASRAETAEVAGGNSTNEEAKAGVVTLRRTDIDEGQESASGSNAPVSSPGTSGTGTTESGAGTGNTATGTGNTATGTGAGNTAGSGAPTTATTGADCKVHSGGFPTRKPVKGQKINPTLCLFNQFGQDYLKYASIVNTEKSTSATFELAADAFGPVRVTISTAVAATTDDGDEDDGGEGDEIGTDAEGDDTEEPTSAQDRALNLLRANGGNLAVTAALPLYYRPFAGGGMFLWNSYARAAGNMQSFGDAPSNTTDPDDMNGSLELAFSELHLDMLGSEKALNLLGYGKTSVVSGTKLFAQALGAEDRTFLHAQLGAGLRVADKFTLFFTYNWYSDDKIPGSGGAITLVMGK